MCPQSGVSFCPPTLAAYIRSAGLGSPEQDFQNLSMEELEKAALCLVKPNRVQHVLGCRDTAVALAKHYGADEVHAARAALLHDATKALGPEQQLALCQEYGITLDSFLSENPKTLHALTGALVAEHLFGECGAVVSAVRHHTTGKADMNLLEKIIYVADYMEPNRDFPGVERLRELAYTDLDGALKLGLTMTLELLQKQGRTVSPQSLEALQWLNRQLS